MKIKSLIGTSFVFYLILMIGFNEPAEALIVWSPQTSGLSVQINAVDVLGTNTAWAVGGSGDILKTTDGGTTWSPQTSGTTEQLFGVSVVDANTVWAVGLFGEIIKTTDGGTVWNSQTSGTTEWLLDISAVDASTAWAVGNSGTILKTTNGGTTWSPQTSGTTNTLQGVSAVDANTVWAVGSSGTIRYTTDGGATWNVQTSPAPSSILFSVSAVDANIAWAVGSGGAILYTINSGTTWSLQSCACSNNFGDVSAFDANTAWAVAGFGIILHTTDGGTTWNSQTSGTTDLLRSVSHANAGIVWVVGGEVVGPGIILKGVETSIIIGTTSITGVCEVDLTTGSLPFGTGDPISNGAGVGVGEISEVLTNTLGNLQSSVGVYGTDWTDGGALTIMLGSHTVVDTVGTGVFGDKTPLSTNSLSPTAIGNIAAQGSITTYWDVEIVMDGGNPGYSGATVQTITFDFTCV